MSALLAYLSPTTAAVVSQEGSYPAWVSRQRPAVTVLLAVLPPSAAAVWQTTYAPLALAALVVAQFALVWRILALHRQAQFSGQVAELAIGANEELEPELCSACLGVMHRQAHATSRAGAQGTTGWCAR